MSSPQPSALEYLRTPIGVPWEWDDYGRVIAWEDGTTIAFREEIEAILERLALTGLPPFSSIVLLLAACRGKLPDLATPLKKVSPAGLATRLGQQERSQEGLELSMLAKLPTELIATLAGKALLVGAVLENFAALSPSQSTEVLRGLGEGLNPTELNARSANSAAAFLTHEFHIVARAVRLHTVESLQRRLRTGLDALPRAAPPLELPAMERARLLLDALTADHQHAGLALVARDVMAAIHLPRVISGEDELSSGGASDLSNRGSLDRLLISELAHDDLTLASRVALNEALYLRREPPARKPERALALLVDSGLRMWGVPRVLSVAAALALIAHHRSDAPAFVWRATGPTLASVDLLTQAGLEAHLGVLETTLHPGGALPAFRVALREAGEVDVVVITHRDALADADFQARLAALALDRAFLLVVDREGSIQLHPLPWGSPRPLAQIEVDVTKLFPRSPAASAAMGLLEPGAVTDFPTIFRVRPFPLLLPVNARMELSEKQKEGGVCVTSDRRLLRWDQAKLGARQLLTDLPDGLPCWLHCDQAGRTIVVKERREQPSLTTVIVRPDEGAEPIVTYCPSRDRPRSIWVDQEVLLLALHDHVTAVSLSTGEILSETPFPVHASWIHSRYFAYHSTVTFASWAGNAVRWDSLVAGNKIAPNEVLTVFDRDGIGAFILTKAGSLLSPAGTVILDLGFSPTNPRVHADGHRIIAMNGARNSWHEINVTARTVRDLRTAKEALAPFAVIPPTRTLQNRFQAIFATPENGIKLLSAKDRWLDLFAAPQRIQLAESATERGVLEAGKHTFHSVPAPASFGCTLKVASWPDGSKAWLDSRGLLHLRSHSSEVPEITLTLSFQAAMAGWTNTGGLCGPAFFVGSEGRENPKPLRDALDSFCRHLC